MADTLSEPEKEAQSLPLTKLRSVWLFFDLGVKGDYEGLYTWLDDHQAKECGDSVAYFRYSYSSDLMDELTKDLKRSITPTNATRLYAIVADSETGKPRGRFLVGSRRSAPWAGRGTLHSESQIDEG